jgi:hypothetical protein
MLIPNSLIWVQEMVPKTGISKKLEKEQNPNNSKFA